MRVIDEALGLLRRFAPIIVAHLLFLFWLGLFVYDSQEFDQAALVPRLLGQLDNATKTLGLPTQRWYVLLGLGVAYFTAVEWLIKSTWRLPLTRIVYARCYDADLLTYARRTLGLDPDPEAVMSAVTVETRRAHDRVRQAGERDPYDYLTQRQNMLESYHGVAVIALVLVLAWAMSGSDLARSSQAVWLTALALFGIVLGLRRYLRRLDNQRHDKLGYWAIDQLERPAWDESGPYSFELDDALERGIRFREAVQRMPHSVVLRGIDRMPKALARRLRRLAPRAGLSFDRDWELFSSQQRRFSDERAPKASQLDARPFAPLFASLLERHGTGLFVLAPETSGLALTDWRGGSAFAFAPRRHDGHGLALTLHATMLDDPRNPPSLDVGFSGNRCFIASCGRHRLVSLIQGVMPDSRPGWRTMIACYDHADSWEVPYIPGDDLQVGEVDIAQRLPVHPGESFLIGCQTESGTQIRIGIECHRIEASERLLIPWAFLDLESDRPEEVLPLPWWRPQAWFEFIGSFKSEVPSS